jgi:hypothetical protein
MDGTELVAAQTYLDQLRHEDRAVDGPADHSVTLISATPEDAEIYDNLVDHSVFVDPTTREALPPDQQASSGGTELPSYYHMQKVDGVWKVVGQSDHA